MFFETRLSRYLIEISCNLREKLFTVQSALSLVLFSLFTGFLFGNLFGTFLDSLRLYFFSNGFVGLFILLLVEGINSLVYGMSFSKRFDYDDKNFLFLEPQKGVTKPSILKQEVSLQPRESYIEGSTTLLELQTRISSNTHTSKEFHKNRMHSPWFSRKLLYKSITHIKRTVNSFKIGLLFGFFVDSFKVGS